MQGGTRRQRERGRASSTGLGGTPASESRRANPSVTCNRAPRPGNLTPSPAWNKSGSHPKPTSKAPVTRTEAPSQDPRSSLTSSASCSALLHLGGADVPRGTSSRYSLHPCPRCSTWNMIRSPSRSSVPRGTSPAPRLDVPRGTQGDQDQVRPPQQAPAGARPGRGRPRQQRPGDPRRGRAGTAESPRRELRCHSRSRRHSRRYQPLPLRCRMRRSRPESRDHACAPLRS